MAKKTSGPGNNPEPVKPREKYPMGKRMKKGTKLDCLGCKGRSTSCPGCNGTGYIVVQTPTSEQVSTLVFGVYSMAKHKYEDVLKSCKNHGSATKQNINGGLIICLWCNRPVRK